MKRLLALLVCACLSQSCVSFAGVRPSPQPRRDGVLECQGEALPLLDGFLTAFAVMVTSMATADYGCGEFHDCRPRSYKWQLSIALLGASSMTYGLIAHSRCERELWKTP